MRLWHEAPEADGSAEHAANERARRKSLGAYYTPDAVVKSLVAWATSSPTDRMLDPSCGDGRFLAEHPNAVGVEQDPEAARIVHQRIPGCLLHEGDFFSWASQTRERFDCAAGNPPFIRYQRFKGAVRDAARSLCSRHGADFSALASSWAPFLVATATLLKPGGRMAFVVPAEVGHAPYAKPLLQYLISNFRRVQVVAVREKVFPELSEDCWLLYADDFGSATGEVLFTRRDRFAFCAHPPSRQRSITISVDELSAWSWRLRPFLMDPEAREAYTVLAGSDATFRLGEVARVGIGYVTGANDFFHLRPSEAARHGIPDRFLVPAVRNGRSLARGRITEDVVREWKCNDDPVLLLRIAKGERPPRSIVRYLNTPAGEQARGAYKCRMREPWYSVPDVSTPDAFLSYMSSRGPVLVSNDAGCVGTNSVHVVKLQKRLSRSRLEAAWKSPLTEMSCEVEGHPLGGGMLKIEPKEAGRVLLCPGDVGEFVSAIREGAATLRRWRHCGEASR